MKSRYYVKTEPAALSSLQKIIASRTWVGGNTTTTTTTRVRRARHHRRCPHDRFTSSCTHSCAHQVSSPISGIVRHNKKSFPSLNSYNPSISTTWMILLGSVPWWNRSCNAYLPMWADHLMLISQCQDRFPFRP